MEGRQKGGGSHDQRKIYERMTVQFVTPDPEIPCEFDDGKPCDLLYQKVCEARERIAERTGLDFEDRDLLAMVEGMEEIGKVLALKMFEYGARFGGEKAKATMQLMDELAKGQISGETEGWVTSEEMKERFIK